MKAILVLTSSLLEGEDVTTTATDGDAENGSPSESGDDEIDV